MAAVLHAAACCLDRATNTQRRWQTTIKQDRETSTNGMTKIKQTHTQSQAHKYSMYTWATAARWLARGAHCSRFLLEPPFRRAACGSMTLTPTLTVVPTVESEQEGVPQRDCASVAARLVTSVCDKQTNRHTRRQTDYRTAY